MNTRPFLAAVRERLQRGGVENAAFEARTLLEIVLGKDSATSAYVSNAVLSDAQTAQTEALLKRRLSGEPLQYLCGSWDFLDSTFVVGEGVLIPRPETEELVLLALERMKELPSPTVYDLCAGSGCIGLSVKRRRSDANVYLFELSDDALRYCNENRCALGFAQTVPLIQADVLRGYAAVSSLPVPDVILSNPPYIATAELPTLQREVQNEPAMALDGGEDGLVFYRAIAENGCRICKRARSSVWNAAKRRRSPSPNCLKIRAFPARSARILTALTDLFLPARAEGDRYDF